MNNTILPSWDEAREKVFANLFPSNFDYEDFLYEKVTHDVNRYYVFSGDKLYAWINKQQLETWGISREIFLLQVNDNMQRLVSSSRIITEDIEGHLLAHIDTADDNFKSSIMLSDHFRDIAEPLLGWPVFAVAPVRDFCFVFSDTDKDFFMEHLGDTVMEEYVNAEYRVTTEILRLSDRGVEAIAKYEEDSEDAV